MRAVDAWAIEEAGAPSLDLMERAGAGLARVTAASRPDGPVRVVIGKGNNGGDGLVVARLLREDGHEVRVLSVAPAAEELRGDAAANLERLPGAPPEPFCAGAAGGRRRGRRRAARHGLRGRPARARWPAAIAALNAQAPPVVACDVPSGVDASTGEVEGRRCARTRPRPSTAAKLGLWVEPGKSHAGLRSR